MYKSGTLTKYSLEKYTLEKSEVTNSPGKVLEMVNAFSQSASKSKATGNAIFSTLKIAKLANFCDFGGMKNGISGAQNENPRPLL